MKEKDVLNNEEMNLENQEEINMDVQEENIKDEIQKHLVRPHNSLMQS